MSAFKELAAKVVAEGHSQAYANGVAAKVGREKYGKAGFAAKAAAGRRKANPMMLVKH